MTEATSSGGIIPTQANGSGIKVMATIKLMMKYTAFTFNGFNPGSFTDQLRSQYGEEKLLQLYSPYGLRD